MGARTFLSRAALGTALLVIVFGSAAPAARAAQEVPSPWTWTDYAPRLLDVACSSPGRCVAVGQRGWVLRRTGGEDAGLAWSQVGPLKSPDELTGVTCTVKFCLAVSNSRLLEDTFHSKVYRSTDNGKTWSRGVELPEASAIKPTQSALALACDPAGACYAVGPDGGVWRSLDGGRSWEALVDLPPASYSRVACPAARTCVAVGGKKDSAVIKNGKVTALAAPEGAGKEMLGLACDTPTRCIATDGLAHFMTLSIKEEKWEAAQPFVGPTEATSVAALACPREGVCVGLGQGTAVALRSTSLADPVTWEESPLRTDKLGAIACAGTTCVAVGKTAAWFVSLDTVDVGNDWARVNEVGKFDTIQCSAPFRPTCVAGGEKTIGVSRSGGELWSLPRNGSLNIKSINCTGPSTCLFLGKTQALFSPDLASFNSRFPPTVDPMGSDVQTCITDTICVGFNEDVVYTTLSGGDALWKTNDFPGGRPASAGCIPGRTNPVVCLVTTTKFLWLGTMTESGGNVRWSWHTVHTPAHKPLTAVACSPGGECTAVSTEGEVLWSVPKTNLGEWKKLVLPDLPKMMAVACPSDDVCLAGGVHGPNAIIASTRDDWAQFSIDTIPGFEDSAPLINSLGCESVTRCVAVGNTPALVGVRKR